MYRVGVAGQSKLFDVGCVVDLDTVNGAEIDEKLVLEGELLVGGLLVMRQAELHSPKFSIILICGYLLEPLNYSFYSTSGGRRTSDLRK